MNREKQIEEIVEHIDNYIQQVDVNHWYNDELDEGLAKYLYQADYRKQSEVVKEIFEDIKAMPKKFTEKSQDFEFGYRIAIQEILAELKKKYAEESGND